MPPHSLRVVLVAPVPRRNYRRPVAVFCCVFGAGTVPSKGEERRRHAVAIITEGAAVCVRECRVCRSDQAARPNTRPSVRRASAAPRAGRCNLISAGRLGRLVAGWRFNRISICLVAASQCRRRCRRHRRCCSRHTAQDTQHRVRLSGVTGTAMDVDIFGAQRCAAVPCACATACPIGDEM